MEPSQAISIDRWGKDHWSTLAYVETCVVDRKGVIDNRKMRCHPRLQGRHVLYHREVVGIMPFPGASQIHDGSKYPTRLKGGETVEHHDDWSCLEDMMDARLVAIIKIRRSPKRRSVDYDYFGGSEVVVKLTEAGYRVAGELRKHLAETNRASTFAPVVVIP